MDAGNEGSPAPIPAGPPPLVKVKTASFNLLKRGAASRVQTQPTRNLNTEQAQAAGAQSQPSTQSYRASPAPAVSQPAAVNAATTSRSSAATNAAAASRSNGATHSATTSQSNVEANAAAAPPSSGTSNAADMSRRASEEEARQLSAKQTATNASVLLRRPAQATIAQPPPSTPSGRAAPSPAVSQPAASNTATSSQGSGGANAAAASQRNDAANTATTSQSNGPEQEVPEAFVTLSQQTATNVRAPVKRGLKFSMKGCLLRAPPEQAVQNGGATATASRSSSGLPLSIGSSVGQTSSSERVPATSSGASHDANVQREASASTSVRAGRINASLNSPFGPIGSSRGPPAQATQPRAQRPDPTRDVLSSFQTAPRQPREAIVRRRVQIDSDIARSVIAEESEDHHSADTNENDEASEATTLADNREHDDDPDDDSEEALLPWTESSPQLFAIIPKKKYAKLIEENHQKIAAANVHQRVAVTLESLRSYKLYARNISGHWHRIRVIGLPASARSREFSLDDSALRRLAGGLVDITELGLSDETFACKCRLLYVRPKDNEPGWSKTAAAAFQRRLAAAQHISVPELSQRNWVTPAEASQPDMVRGLVDIFADGESVSQALVAEGHADWNYSST